MYSSVKRSVKREGQKRRRYRIIMFSQSTRIVRNNSTPQDPKSKVKEDGIA